MITPVHPLSSQCEAEFDVERAEALAGLESYNRHLYRPNAYLHKWWARRCGTTFRFILKSLVPDPGRRAFEAEGGLEGLIVMDPMMGSGTTLYEAVRMGASVIGIDIDPIPVLMARAALSNVPLESLQNTFAQMLEYLQEQLEGFWETQCPYCQCSVPVRFVLYGRERVCRCGTALFVDTFTLRQEKKRTAFRLTEDGSVVDGGDHIIASNKPVRILLRETTFCALCGERFRDRVEIPFRHRYRPVAVSGKCPWHGEFFAPPLPEDLFAIEEAERRLKGIAFDNFGHFAIRPGPKSSDLLRMGIRSYTELFSARQLIFLNHAIAFIRDISDPLVRLHMALLVSTSLEFNSLLCGYKGYGSLRPGAVRHVFAHHAYSIPYTALENNPIYPAASSGTLLYLFRYRMERGKLWALKPREILPPTNGRREIKVFTEERAIGQEAAVPEELTTGKRRFLLIHGSATDIPLPENFVDLVVTDPPYYDNVQYNDLAAFFRVWLSEMLPDDIAWEKDLSALIAESPDGDPHRYAEILGRIFTECRRVLKPQGQLVLTFHHWRPEAWAALTVALRRGGFGLLQFYVIHAENPISVHIAGQRALTHDAVLFLERANTLFSSSWELPPAPIETADSREFVTKCAVALGAMLSLEIDEQDIWSWWRKAMR